MDEKLGEMPPPATATILKTTQRKKVRSRDRHALGTVGQPRFRIGAGAVHAVEARLVAVHESGLRPRAVYPFGVDGGHCVGLPLIFSPSGMDGFAGQMWVDKTSHFPATRRPTR